MRIKLDENLGTRGAQLLKDGGCDVATVLSEGLCSSPDETLIEVCRVEKRVLVSLDKGFASILRFPPTHYAGIVVRRLPEPLTSAALERGAPPVPRGVGPRGPHGPTVGYRRAPHP